MFARPALLFVSRHTVISEIITTRSIADTLLPHVTVTCCVHNTHLATLDPSNTFPAVPYLKVDGRQVRRFFFLSAELLPFSAKLGRAVSRHFQAGIDAIDRGNSKSVDTRIAANSVPKITSTA